MRSQPGRSCAAFHPGQPAEPTRLSDAWKTADHSIEFPTPVLDWKRDVPQANHARKEIGGNVVGAAANNVSLGAGGNTAAGAVGGIAGWSSLTSLISMLAGGANGVDIGVLAGQLVGGGVSGAIVTAIIGVIMNNMKRA